MGPRLHQIVSTLIAGAVGSILTSCAPGTEKAHSQLMADETPQWLGQGRHSLNGRSMAECLDFTVVRQQGGSRELSIGRLNGPVDLAGRLGVPFSEITNAASSDPLAQLALTLDRDPRVMNVLIKFQRTYATERVHADAKLKESMQDTWQTSFREFTSTCGDQFLKEYRHGDALYAIVAIYVDSDHQKATLQSTLENLGQTEDKLGITLGELPLKTVNYLYVGKAAGDLFGNTGSHYLLRESPGEFALLYEHMRTGTPLNDQTSVVIDRKYALYSDVLRNTDPAEDSQSWEDFRSTFDFLNQQDLEAAACEARLNIMKDRGLEFKVPLQTETGLSLVKTYKEMLEEAKLSCIGALEDSTLDLADCAFGPEMVAQMSMNLGHCEAGLFSLHHTDAFMYREYQTSAKLKNELGAMKELSKIEGTAMTQAFEKGYMVRAQYAKNKFSYYMDKRVYAAWRRLAAKIKDPLARFFTRTGVADIYFFEEGRLFHVGAERGSGVVYAVHKLADHMLWTSIPKADEIEFANDKVERALVKAHDYAYFLQKAKAANSKATVVKLERDDAFAEFFLKKTINWGVPLTEPKTFKSNADDRYVLASDGKYYWHSKNLGPFGMSDAMHKLFLKVGGPAVMGSVKKSESCVNKVCTLTLEKDKLQMDDKGKRICPKDQVARDDGSCRDKNWFVEYCRNNPTKCFPTVLPEIPRLPVLPRLP
ncbi:hypothetical protein [Oligoflexus tunisiensis]|uniref:hypothetical protein n=1 Tax=Oligoflexus tunisiensis TaxID=708132 RepID=UPI00114D20F8|nr:hypothetical protein [Oligoflexus tunisiensis]